MRSALEATVRKSHLEVSMGNLVTLGLKIKIKKGWRCKVLQSPQPKKNRYGALSRTWWTLRQKASS